MPITVDAPDGSQVEFPDSMKQEDIEKVMQENYPTESPSKGIKSLQDVGVNPQQYVAGGGGMAGISLIPAPGPAGESPLGSYIPETPDIKGESLLGQAAAAPVNVGKHLVEGVVSPLGVGTMGLGPVPKLAQAAIGAGFGIPAAWEGVRRVYSGAAWADPQEVMEGTLQALTGGLITGGAVHGAIPEAKVAAKPPLIPPPKYVDVEPPQTAKVNLEPPADTAVQPPPVSTEVPPIIDKPKETTTPPEQPVTTPVPGESVSGGGGVRPETVDAIKEVSRIFGKDRILLAFDEYLKNFNLQNASERVKGVQLALFAKNILANEPKSLAAIEAVGDNLRSERPSIPPAPVSGAASGVPPTPVVAPEGAVPPIIGMGGAALDEVVPTGTSLKNASGALERIGLGLKEAPETVRKNMEEAWAKAETAEQQSPGMGENLASMLKRDPDMGLTDVESALLLRHKVDLFNKLNDATEKTHVGDAAARKSAQALHDSLLVQYEDLLDAVKQRGSEWGREGRWRQAMARDDFTFSSVEDMNRYRRALSGEDMPGKKLGEAEKKAKAVKATTDASDQATGALIDEIKTKVKTPPVINVEKAALDAANKTVRENAVRLADAETKVRVAQTVNEKVTADIQRRAAQKAYDASIKQRREAAIAAAKAETEVKVRPKLDEQLKASRDALAAADKTVRENAKRVADADTKSRVAKSAKDRADAIKERRAAQKVLDAKNREYRNAAIALAKAERALQGDPSKRVWARIKDYIEKGVDNPDDIRNRVATDLGMSVDNVTRTMAKDARVKRMMDDAWIKQQKAAAMRQQAKNWVRNIDTPAFEKALQMIPRAMFGLKVGFHGTVALGTHAPLVAFQPQFWGTYIRDFGKMYKMVGSPKYYEQQAADLIRRPNYVKARRAGLVNDPRVYEDYNSPDTAKYFGRLTGMGNRGYTILKILRQDMFDQMYNNLPRSLQVQDGVLSALADDINHATGVVQGFAPKGTNLALFAPRLEASRVMTLVGDPARAIQTFKNWDIATDGEKMFAVNQVKQKLWIAGTYFSILAANQGMLSAMGSKQKINGIPEAFGGAGIDPLESDFLKFKVADRDVAYGSAMVNMAKLPVRMVEALMYHGKGSKYVLEDERIDKIIMDYLRSQASPFAGTAVDLAIGRDYAGRPLPRAGFGLLPGRKDVPKRLQKHGITEPYTWGEYSAQQFTPIPISEMIREVWGKGLGMSDKQIEAYLKAFLTAGAMGGTGSRITEDRNIQEE